MSSQETTSIRDRQSSRTASTAGEPGIRATRTKRAPQAASRQNREPDSSAPQ